MDRKYKINAIFSILFVLFSSIFGIIKVPIIITSFGNYENGFFAQVLTISVMFNVVDAGITSIMNTVVTKFYFQKNWEQFNIYFSMVRKITNFMTMLALLLLVALSVFLPLIEKSFVYHGSHLKSVIYIFIIFLPQALYFFKSHFMILIYCYKQTMIVEFSNFINSLIILVAIIIAQKLNGNMVYVVLATTIFAIINNFWWKYYFHRKAKRDNLKSNLKVKIDRNLLSDSKFSSILIIFSNISRGVNYPIISHFYANVILSQYSSIMNYISGVNLIFIATLLNVTYNTFLELDAYSDKTKLNEAIKTHTILQQFVIVNVVGGILVFFPSFLKIVGFMNPRTDNLPYIIIAVVEMYLWWAMMRFNHLAYIRKEFKKMVLPFISTTILNISLSVFFTAKFGPYGVLMGSIVQWILMYIYLSWLVNQHFINDLVRVIKGFVFLFGMYFGFTKFVNLSDLNKIHTIIPYFISATPRIILFVIITSTLFILTEITLIKKIKLFIEKKFIKKLNK